MLTLSRSEGRDVQAARRWEGREEVRTMKLSINLAAGGKDRVDAVIRLRLHKNEYI
jgi:hypothetical protein